MEILYVFLAGFIVALIIIATVLSAAEYYIKKKTRELEAVAEEDDPGCFPPPKVQGLAAQLEQDMFVTKPVKRRRRRGVIDRATRSSVLQAFERLGSVDAVRKELGMGRLKVIAILDEAKYERRHSKRNSIEDETRRAIQEAMMSGERSRRDVAKEFGVSVTTVGNICMEELP